MDNKIRKHIKSDSATIRTCSQIVAYVTGPNIVNWQIVLLDGTQVYSSENKIEYDTWIFDLSTIDLPVGTQFKLRGKVTVKEHSSVDILQYQPLSNTVYYTYDQNYFPDEYVGYIWTIDSPYSPPIARVSTVEGSNQGIVADTFVLRYADGSGDVYTNTKGGWSKDLAELCIEPGTKLLFYTDVKGNDSQGYAIIEYDPDSNKTIAFTLRGNTFYTVTVVGNMGDW